MSSDPIKSANEPSIMHVYSSFVSDPSFCPSVYDGFICWPATPAGQNVALPCPKGVPGLVENSEISLLLIKLASPTRDQII